MPIRGRVFVCCALAASGPTKRVSAIATDTGRSASIRPLIKFQLPHEGGVRSCFVDAHPVTVTSIRSPSDLRIRNRCDANELHHARFRAGDQLAVDREARAHERPAGVGTDAICGNYVRLAVGRHVGHEGNTYDKDHSTPTPKSHASFLLPNAALSGRRASIASLRSAAAQSSPPAIVAVYRVTGRRHPLATEATAEWS